MSVIVAAGEQMTETQATYGDAQERRVLVADISCSILSTFGGATFTIGDGTVIGDTTKVIA